MVATEASETWKFYLDCMTFIFLFSITLKYTRVSSPPCMKFCSIICEGSSFTRLLDRDAKTVRRFPICYSLSFDAYHSRKCSWELTTSIPLPLRYPNNKRALEFANGFYIDNSNFRITLLSSHIYFVEFFHLPCFLLNLLSLKL